MCAINYKLILNKVLSYINEYMKPMCEKYVA